MRHEEWLDYQRQSEQEKLERFGPVPKTQAETIAELRAKVDSFAGRIKAELLAELRVEVERLISMEVTHASQQR